MPSRPVTPAQSSELIELTTADATDERFPLAGEEHQDRTLTVLLGVTDSDRAVVAEADFDAVVAAAGQAGLPPTTERALSSHDVSPFWMCSRRGQHSVLHCPRIANVLLTTMS